MNIPTPLFNLDTAIPLGLMINELISNSLEHAFFGEEGKISVVTVRDKEGKIKSIEYTDTGSSLEPGGGGFGTVLLNVLSAQLELKMSVEPDGPYKFTFYA